MDLSGALTDLFDGEDVSVLSDHKAFVEHLASDGVAALTFDDLRDGSAPPRAAVVCSSSFDTFPSYAELDYLLGDSRVLLIPQASFAGDLLTLQYAFERLLGTQWRLAVETSHRLLAILQRSEAILISSPAGTSLSLTFGEEVNLLSHKFEVDIAPSEWTTAANYLEMSLIAPARSSRPHHRLTGTVVADGSAVAFHRHQRHLSGPVAARSWQFLSTLRRIGEYPLTIEVDQSLVQTIRTSSGRDITQLIVDLVEPACGPATVEVALATVAPDARWTPDWSFNTPMNEAVGGFHIGLGSGVTHAHVDFIDSSAKWTP